MVTPAKSVERQANAILHPIVRDLLAHLVADLRREIDDLRAEFGLPRKFVPKPRVRVRAASRPRP